MLTPLFGARRPTEDEVELIEPLWVDIAHANRLPPQRYILRVLPSIIPPYPPGATLKR